MDGRVRDALEHAYERLLPSVVGAASQVAIEVIDSGIGMDDAVRARVFEPFSQVHGSVTREFGGTGLGLSIVERIGKVLAHPIALQSNALRGSTFSVTVSES